MYPICMYTIPLYYVEPLRAIDLTDKNPDLSVHRAVIQRVLQKLQRVQNGSASTNLNQSSAEREASPAPSTAHSPPETSPMDVTPTKPSVRSSNAEEWEAWVNFPDD
jgi:hypothetical protein